MTNPICAGTRRFPAILSFIVPTLSLPAPRAQETPPSAGGLSLDLNVIAEQLDVARIQIPPNLGAVRTSSDRNAAARGQSVVEPALLQALGVAQDSFDQMHIRGDHANLQYGLNGVHLPKGINVFGQALQTRLANSAALITGALPAQYGLRTAGIIDIQTKTGTLDPGGSVTLYGGSQSWFQPSIEFGGRVGQIDYFVTANACTMRSGSRTRPPASTFLAGLTQRF